MTTRLNAPFKRELEVNGETYTLTVSQDGFRLVLKGHRKGVELTWASIVGGEAALALAAALEARPEDGQGPGGTGARGPFQNDEGLAVHSAAGQIGGVGLEGPIPRRRGRALEEGCL